MQQIPQKTLKVSALGEDIQLGMLYDYKTSTFYSGASPWRSSVANPAVNTPAGIVQNAEYKVFTSLNDARKYADLSTEGSLSLDLGILQATGSAAYLSKKKSTAYEARVDVSCTIVRRTRCIPQETLVKLEYPKRLDNNDFTHFVAEVVEGGTATLTFVQSCDSLEEMKEVQGCLEATLKRVNFTRNKADVKLENIDAINTERLSISYSGALAVQVATLEDAFRVAKEMPDKLQKQMNTLSCKLHPVSLLDNAYSRQIKYLDKQLLKQTSDALHFGEGTLLELRHFRDTENKFSMLAPQIHNMINAVDVATCEFSSKLRELLPELRDARADTAAKKDELQSAVKLYQFQMQAASRYLDKKRNEARYLNNSVEELCNLGFENEVNGTTTYSHPLGGPPTLLLSLGGESVTNSLHPLQRHVESRQVGIDVSPDEEDWFEVTANKERVHDSYEKLKALKVGLGELGDEAPKVMFVVANISKEQHNGSRSGSTCVSTVPGDVVLGQQGTLVLVTGELPGDAPQPTFATVFHDCVIIDVPKFHLGGSEPEPINILTPTGTVVRWRRRGDSSWTGTVSHEWRRDARQFVVSPLLPEIKYEVQMRILTKLGPTRWSTTAAVVTTKAPRPLSKHMRLSPTTTDLEDELIHAAFDTSTLDAVKGNRSGIVVVYVNADSVAQNLSLDFSGFNSVTSSATVTPVMASAADARVQGTSVTVSSKSAALTVPASSVLKLVISGVSGVLTSSALIRPCTAYLIQEVLSSKYLQPPSTTSTSLVINALSSGSTEQQWMFCRLASGTFSSRDHFLIFNVGSGKRLAVSSSGTPQLEADSGAVSSYAQWLVSTSGDCTFTIENAGVSAILDVTGQSNSDNPAVITHNPKVGSNRSWKIRSSLAISGMLEMPASPAQFQHSMAYLIQGVQSSKYLQPSSTGTSLVINALSSGSTAQQWMFCRLASAPCSPRDHYVIVNVGSGQRLTVSPAGSPQFEADSGMVSLYSQWLISTAANGTLTIANAGVRNILDVTGRSTANYTAVITYKPNSGTNQSWKITQA